MTTYLLTWNPARFEWSELQQHVEELLVHGTLRDTWSCGCGSAQRTKQAAGICEACNEPAPFTSATGRPYLEVHHIRRLSDDGPDHPSWVAALCPNCHRRAHHAADRIQFSQELTRIVHSKEKQLAS